MVKPAKPQKKHVSPVVVIVVIVIVLAIIVLVYTKFNKPSIGVAQTPAMIKMQSEMRDYMQKHGGAQRGRMGRRGMMRQGGAQQNPMAPGQPQ